MVMASYLDDLLPACDAITPITVLVLAGRAQRGAARHPSGLPRAPTPFDPLRGHTPVLRIWRTQKRLAPLRQVFCSTPPDPSVPRLTLTGKGRPERLEVIQRPTHRNFGSEASKISECSGLLYAFTLIMQLPRAFRCNESHQLPEAT